MAPALNPAGILRVLLQRRPSQAVIFVEYEHMKPVLTGAATALSLLALAGAASAETTAKATTDLNIRSGPGPHFEVVGVIGASEEASVMGCLADGKWCQVTHDGTNGWAYSDYLMASFDKPDTLVVLTERPAEALPAVTFEAPMPQATAQVTAQATSQPAATTTVTTTTTTKKKDPTGGALAGAATGVVAGALLGGPVGAAIGGVAGAVTGGTVDAAVTPPDEVVTYVQTNKVEPVYLEGEVVVGAGLPETVTVHKVPDYQYDYVYVNGQPVLVDPSDRRIVAVVR